MISGIYYIRNVQNDKMYIGSSKDVEKRIHQHQNALKNGKHINVHLQRAYELYGAEAFDYGILEQTEELFIREEFYIKQIDTTGLYNLGTVGGGDNISNHPNKIVFIERMRQKLIENYKNASNEQRKKLSLRMHGESNPNYGHRWDSIQKSEASARVRKRYEDNPILCKKIADTLKYKWENMEDSAKMKVSPRMRRIRIADTIYYGMNHAAKATGLNPYTIRYRAGSDNFPEYSFID